MADRMMLGEIEGQTKNRQGRHNDVEGHGETDERTDRADIMVLRKVERQPKEQTGTI